MTGRIEAPTSLGGTQPQAGTLRPTMTPKAVRRSQPRRRFQSQQESPCASGIWVSCVNSIGM